MNARYRFAAVACAAAVAVSASPASFADEGASVNNNATTKYWTEKTTSLPEVTFVTHGDKLKNIDWTVLFSDDPGYITLLSQGNKEFGAKVDSAPKLSELARAGAPEDDHPIPAVKPDGTLVAVLPHGPVRATDEGVTVKDVTMRADVTVGMPDGNATTLPAAPPSDSLHLLYGAPDGKGTGSDPADAARPAIAAGMPTWQYNSRKKNGNDPAPNEGMLSQVTPGTMNRLVVNRFVANRTGKPVDFVVTPLIPTSDRDADKADGDNDGLTPIDTGARAGQTVNESTTVRQEVDVNVPDGVTTVYLHSDVVDKSGNSQTTPAMMNFAAEKLALDAQASTENGNAQLKPDAKQTVWNQAALGNLMPGKPYNVVAQLFQCDGECLEVAAVNREIIPQQPNSLQNFAVDVDTSVMPDQATLEWQITVHEGTGQFDQMGPVLAEITDHPYTQVLSFSGTSESTRDGQRTDEHAGREFVDEPLDDAERVEGNPDVEDARQADGADAAVRDEAPPADMQTVRENNEKLKKDGGKSGREVTTDREAARQAERDDTKHAWLTGGAIAATVLAIAGVVAWLARTINKKGGGHRG